MLLQSCALISRSAKNTQYASPCAEFLGLTHTFLGASPLGVGFLGWKTEWMAFFDTATKLSKVVVSGIDFLFLLFEFIDRKSVV